MIRSQRLARFLREMSSAEGVIEVVEGGRRKGISEARRDAE